MKRIFAVILAALILFLSGCELVRDKNNNNTPGSLSLSTVEHIKTYRDIPGVTEKDIADIEALKSERDKFIYGVLLSTEAFELPDGSYGGFAIKFSGLLSELFGINIVHEFYEWDELMEKFETGAVDFTGELTPNDERKQVYGMSLPVAERMLRIFTRADSDKINNENDVAGFKIGFLEGSVTADSIRKTYPVEFTAVEVPDYNAAAEMIKNREIDAFIDEAVADPVFVSYDFIRSEVFFPMVHEPVSLATANPGLYPFIAALDKYLGAGGVDKLYELYREGDYEYAKYKLHKSFTDEERAYIDDLASRGEAVAVAFEHDNYPVNFYNAEDHEFEGIAVDVLAEISRLAGIKFKPAVTKDTTWAEILEKLQTGEINMVAQLLVSESRKNQFIWSATPYSSTYYALMSKLDYPNLATYQVARVSVGSMKGSGKGNIYRELFPDNAPLIEYDTQNDCLDALERGEIDLLMASEYMLLMQINYREKPGFKINIKLDASMDSYFGFPKNQTVLRSIIDKAQQYVDCEMIEINWTGRTFDYSKKILEYRAGFLSIFAGVLFIILLGSGFLMIKLFKLSKKLKDIASNDALTGIFNRRYFMEFAMMQVERSIRTNIDCFVVIFDLDHFKAVNDTYGHQGGDKVLKETARLVKKKLRPYDLLGRYGGEEFIILLSEIKEITKETAISVTERIRLDINNTPVDYNGAKIPVTASFGIAYAAPKNDLETAIKFADEALYQAKKSGRNKVIFSEDSAGK